MRDPASADVEAVDRLATPLQDLILMALAVLAGALVAIVVLPAWLPGLVSSLASEKPKVSWLVARSSAFVAFGLLWLSMAIGLLMTNKLARVWPGGPTAFDLHQYVSLLGLGVALFHGAILLGDRYMESTLFQLVVPFANTPYRPLAVGLGQTAFYLMAIVGLSFFVRQRIGPRRWRLIHFASFLTFLLALAHGILSGTDRGEWWAGALYWSSAGSLLFLTIYRLLVATVVGKARPVPNR